MQILRELNDPTVIRACLDRWASLLPDAQLALLDAHVKLGAEALKTVRLAGQGSDAALRAAAWQAAAELNDLSSIPALAKAATSTDASEKEAARQALARLRGPQAREALLAQVETLSGAEKAEVLRAFGERGDTAVAQVLLKHAASDNDTVRVAALESLRRLAVPETIAPLLELAAKSPSDRQRAPILKALFAVCQASPDKAGTARSVVASVNRFPPAERRQVLPLLAELGTPDALEAALAATRETDGELAKEAVRVLAQWPNAAPAPPLLELARSGSDATLRTLAFRSAVEVSGQDSDAARRLAFLQQAMSAARDTDQKKQVISQVGQVASPAALTLTLNELANSDLASEAALASVSIAEKLAPGNATLADDAAKKVLAQVKEGDIAKRAWALRIKPSSAASFIKDWIVAGPYRQAGATGAEGLFNIPFGPEKPGEKVAWKTVPNWEHVNLMALFGEQGSCAAYLRTEVIAPQDVDGALLMGSDDGIKAWLNGKVVHENNIDRGEVTDQDTAPIKLKKGTNDLLVKITQGGGGWSASARIVGSDGKPVPGLMTQRPAGAGAPVQASAPKAAATPPPAPKATPATLPAKEPFKKLRLTGEFYTEGAYYGDFNRDGKMDVVAGPFWFEGPDFQKRHEYRPAKVYDPKGYSDNFLTYTGDFNGDGWTDIFCVPFPGVEGFWFENPKGQGGAWKKRLAYNKVGNESPVWGDVTGDGRAELIFNNDGYLGFASPNPSRPDEPWAFTAVSTKDKRFQQFTHGVGFGDLNADGRVDILEGTGWWEQPAQPQPGQPWIFHPFRFAEWAAQMLVGDVNGDGLPDVITAWNCHLYGMVWWEQVKGAQGQPEWKKHEILSPAPDVTKAEFRVSQMHALEWVDMNGDGVKDILTGKRFWAHGPTGDKEPDAPAVVFWFETRRSAAGQVTFVPRLIDDDSGVGTQVAATDLNGDQKPDVIVGNKKGIFVHVSGGP